MGLIEKLLHDVKAALGRRPKIADPLAATVAAIAEIDEILTRIEAERVIARTAIAEANIREQALLLEDASFEAMEAHRRASRELEDTIKALDLFERQQQRKRAELATKRGELTLDGIRRRWNEAAPRHLATVREALSQRVAMLALWDEAMAAGFERHAAELFPAPPYVLNAEIIEPWAVSVAQRADDYVAPPMPKLPAPAARSPVMPALRSTRVTLAVPMPPAAPKPEPLPPARKFDGAVRMRVLRSGYPDADSVGRSVNELVWISPETAKIAALHGAVEYVGEVES